MPTEVSRIALIDFHNDCIGETRKIMGRMFTKYLELYTQGKLDEAMKYKLFGVRPDTSKNMRDRSIIPTGNTDLDNGVSSKLVWNLREFLDTAYEEWDLPEERVEIARKWCKEVKIVVTGGFNDKKIKDFEDMGVPVDFYGVGSSLLDNSSETNNDFTADIVMSQMPNGDWISIAKIGRCACNNVNLKRIDFTKLL
jgi:nicotinate phosphoribosyltransferase